MDHPRSRGVYADGPAAAGCDEGSSPLARGLLRDVVLTLRPGGIIPARAGFTGSRGSVRNRKLDHPRSRGVYLTEPLVLERGEGSSPLARGLRRRGHGGEVPGRIIPARAGFTPVLHWGRSPAGDHPRSRGVYVFPGIGVICVSGSSPLARGLRRSRGSVSRTSRIIPARAGFTRGLAGAGHALADHPRSRGVYSHALDDVTMEQGSSPLARGLHGPRRPESARHGIIPARAGFTMTSGLWAA